MGQTVLVLIEDKEDQFFRRFGTYFLTQSSPSQRILIRL